MQKRELFILVLFLLALGIVGRLVPHTPNFTPIVAVALFAGVYLGRAYAIVVPLLALLSNDIFIGFYEWEMMLAVYGSFALTGLIGWWVRTHKNVETLLAGTLGASILFFLITNWAVWQFGSLYPDTLDGLLQSYTLALPFFRNMLMGDLFYTFALFGAYEAVLSIRARLTLSSSRI